MPGGNIENIMGKTTFDIIRELNERKVLIAGICAGVEVLYEAGYWKESARHMTKSMTA